MKSVVLYSRNDFVKSKLGTLFVISHLHDDMVNAVKYAKDVKFFKYCAQRLEVKNNMKFGGDFGHELVESSGDKALVLYSDMITIHDDFSGNFTYVGTFDDVKAAYGITSCMFKFE